jgi:hypothetical protein
MANHVDDVAAKVGSIPVVTHLFMFKTLWQIYFFFSVA